MALPNEPITRQEMYLSNIAGQNTALPDAPITREEMYLDYIAKTGGTGEGDMKKSVYDSDNSVATAGGIKMFVNQKIGTLPQRVGSLETTAGVLQGEVVSIENTLGGFGTASTKNSTSVVTDSSDLVESGAVKDIVGWGNKNLLDLKNSGFIDTTNVIASKNDGVVTFTNNANTDTYYRVMAPIDIPDSGEYILSGCSANGSTSTYFMYIQASDFSETYREVGGGVTCQLDKTKTYNCYIKLSSGYGDGKVFKPMLRKAGMSDTFEPYHASVEEYIPQVVSDAVGWDGDNQLKAPYSSTSISGGINITANDDGSISLSSGKATEREIFYLRYHQENFKPPKGLYKFSKGFTSGAVGLVCEAYNGSTWVKSIGASWSNDEIEINIDYVEYDRLNIYLAVNVNTELTTDITCLPKLTHLTVDEQKADNSVIGTVEDDTNPTKAYAVGEHMIRGGKFCTVTVAVTTSSTWVEGSNYTSGDVAGCLTTESGTLSDFNANITRLHQSEEGCFRYGKIAEIICFFRVDSAISGVEKLFKTPFESKKISGSGFGVPMGQILSGNPPYNSIGVSFYITNYNEIKINGTLPIGDYLISITYICE